MTATIAHGPNADLIPKFATTADDHRRGWEAIARSAQRSLDNALAGLEDEALAIFRADDKAPLRFRRLPPNLGHLLTLAAEAAESSIAAAELDLAQARKHAHGGQR